MLSVCPRTIVTSDRCFDDGDTARVIFELPPFSWSSRLIISSLTETPSSSGRLIPSTVQRWRTFSDFKTHFKTCTTDIYLHIKIARMSGYLIDTDASEDSETRARII
eukprot:COSAG05_NODE_406_length_10149_cov_13.684478_3_plen_107_part_00